MIKLLTTVAAATFCAAAIAGPKEEALEVLHQWTKAFAESDVDGITKLYATDALFMGTGSKTLVTKPAEIRTYFEQALLVTAHAVPRWVSIPSLCYRIQPY